MDELTASEAAEVLGVTPHHVRWYHHNGYLPGRKDDVLVFPREAVERLNGNKPKKSGRPRKKRNKR